MGSYIRNLRRRIHTFFARIHPTTRLSTAIISVADNLVAFFASNFEPAFDHTNTNTPNIFLLSRPRHQFLPRGQPRLSLFVLPVLLRHIRIYAFAMGRDLEWRGIAILRNSYF